MEVTQIALEMLLNEGLIFHCQDAAARATETQREETQSQALVGPLETVMTVHTCVCVCVRVCVQV